MSQVAVDFLKAVYPAGPWALTWIQDDKKSIQTRTFGPETEKECLAWVEEANGKRNIYWHVNPVMRPVSKKAEREDIKEVCYLHVDIDPRVGENLADEKLRALSLLTDKLPKGIPAPSIIVFSGGGFQGFWKLAVPIPINGVLEAAEDAKRYNQQLEVVFSADNCHNIDRLCRLPGTWNIPDRKKLKKGRVKEMASVHFLDLTKVYGIEQFMQAPKIQMKASVGFSSGKAPSVSGNIKRLADVDELNEWNVPDRVKVAIVQGQHPEEKKEGDNSRSAWLFDVCCQLVRAQVPEEVIYAVITDPEFGISESVLDKGTNSEKYALRQIERAREEAVDPWLRKLNEQFAVIGNMGGKCRVIEEVMDFALKRTKFTKQSFQDFTNRFMNERIRVGVDKNGEDILMPVGKWWLNHFQRRQYNSLVFVPGHEIPGAYNLWKGFGCESRPGDCGLFLEHVKKNVCSGSEEHYEYLMRWLARAVQRPDSPGEVAVVLRGKRGVGKSFFAKEIGALFGRHFLHISNSSHLVGNFNSHLRDVVFLFADEAFYANDRKHISILKTLITEDTFTVEAKGVDAEAAPNYTHILMASNDHHVIPAGGDERRFFVLDVCHDKQQNTEYFAGIRKEMDSGGREALLHHLLSVKLEGFEVRKIPATEALREQKLLSLSVEEEWWFNKLRNGEIIAGQLWEDKVGCNELLNDYIEYTKRLNIPRRANETHLGMFLRRICPGMKSIRQRDNSSRVRCYLLPSLSKARDTWEQANGHIDWEVFEEQNEISPF